MIAVKIRCYTYLRVAVYIWLLMKHILQTVPHLPEVEFLKGQYTNFAYDAHFHEEYVVSIVIKGVHTFHYRGNKHIVPSGNATTCQPGEVRAGYQNIETYCDYRTMFLRPSLIEQVATEIGYKSASLPFFSHTQITDQRVTRSVLALHQYVEAGYSPLLQAILLKELLKHLLVNYSEVPVTPDTIKNEYIPIKRAKAYIIDNYKENIKLDDLAAIAYLSKSHFIRVFRHYENISPYAYLMQVRLNRAKTLLQQGHLPVNVAQHTGFHDQSHFTRYFKHFLRLTPGQYQKAIQ